MVVAVIEVRWSCLKKITGVLGTIYDRLHLLFFAQQMWTARFFFVCLEKGARVFLCRISGHAQNRRNHLETIDKQLHLLCHPSTSVHNDDKVRLYAVCH